jgi:hypothetical protein
MKTFAKVIIVTSCVFFWIIIALWYFFGFDLQWGVTWQSVTLGLPLLAAIILVPLCIVYFFKKRKWRWGFSAVGIAVIILVYTGLILWNYSYMIVGEPKSGPKETLATEENRILTLLLTKEKGNRGYAIVDPEVYLWYLDNYTEDNILNLKKNLAQEYRVYNSANEAVSLNVSLLFDHFIELNREKMSLNLKSSPQNGYYIDYDGKFSRYFEKGGGGWIRQRLFRPGTNHTEISIPVYDKNTGLVIVYIGWDIDYLFGSGGIYMFEYKNDELKYINYDELWIS